MKKEQIEGKVPAADLDRIFRSDKTEVATELNKKVLKPRKETAMKIVFGVGVPASPENSKK